MKYQADDLEAGVLNGENYRKLKHHVLFSQENTKIFCDSAVFFTQKNIINAYGHVKILDGDSISITGNKLFYDGNTKNVQIRENVVYINGNKKLYTHHLDHEMKNRISHYFHNGKLQDSINTLVSKSGHFYASQNHAKFIGNVELTSPQYRLYADTLLYHTTTKIAITIGKTTVIYNDSTRVYSQGGEFKTIPEQSSLITGNIETKDYFIAAKNMFFDKKNKHYTASGNVKMNSKHENVTLTGDTAFYWKNKGYSKIFGNPIMKKILKKDTIYISSDTIIATEKQYDSVERIIAYNNVKIFSHSVQGKTDSLLYLRNDSLLIFYKDPVLWHANNQMTGEPIEMTIADGQLNTMYIKKKSFVINQDSLNNFNQMKGKDMKVFFINSNINTIHVNGNGQTIYFVIDESDSSLTGMNSILCSNMILRFQENDLDNISFYIRPESIFFPPHLITPKNMYLEDFKWRIKERPTLLDILKK